MPKRLTLPVMSYHLSLSRMRTAAKQVAAPPDPGPTPAERIASLTAQLHDLDRQLGGLNREALELRNRHALKIDGLGRINGMCAESLNSFQSIERQWRILQRQAYGLKTRRDQILRERALLVTGVQL